MIEHNTIEIEDNLLAGVYQKFPVIISKGKGAKLWDNTGKEYIDCMGGYGVSIIGHCNPKIQEAIQKQAQDLITCHGSLYNEVRAEFAESLSKKAIHGSDSNENAHIEADFHFSSDERF